MQNPLQFTRAVLPPDLIGLQDQLPVGNTPGRPFIVRQHFDQRFTIIEAGIGYKYLIGVRA